MEDSVALRSTAAGVPIGGPKQGGAAARRLLTRILFLIDSGVGVLAAGILVGDALLTVVTVAIRAATGYGIPWTTELSEVAIVWLALLGSVTAFQREEHIGLTAVADRWPESWKPAAKAASLTLVTSFMCMITWQAIVLLNAGTGYLTVTGWSRATLYAPLLFASVMIASIALLRLAAIPIRSVAVGAGLLAVILGTAWFGIADQLMAVAQHLPLLAAGIVFFLMMSLGIPLAFDLGLAGIALLVMDPSLTLRSVPQLMLNALGTVVLFAVPFFIFTGAILNRGGIAAALMRFLGDMTGFMRGGTAVTGVLGMYLFSGLSGSKVADIAAVGPVLTPGMKANGHSGDEAAGILCASAAMGEAVPPSVAILVLTSVTSVSTGALFMAGLLPAAAVGLCLIATILIRAHRRHIPRPGVPPLRQVGRDFARSIVPAGMPVIIFGGIIFGLATPTEASALAVLYGLLIGVVLYGVTPSEVVRSAVESARLSGMLLFLLTTVAVVLYVFSIDGVADQFHRAALLFQGNRMAFMLASLAVLVITGMIFEGLPAIVIFAPLLLPVAISMGISPLQYSIVLLMSMGVGAFLPPIGVGYFSTCALIGTRPERSLRETSIYMAAAVAGIVLIAAVPQITTLLPEQLHIRGA